MFGEVESNERLDCPTFGQEMDEYEAKLKQAQEEQANHRKALELELKKLRTEV